jgi:beta-lactamase regulating signal transducer with metallopeptidase domain
VGLGFFGVLYCLLSLLVAGTWQCLNALRGASDPGSASSLFWLRVFPLAASAFVTVAFAVPAFLLLESSAIDEDSGTLAFGVCSLLLIGAGLLRGLTARSKTSRIVTDWMDGASAMNMGTAAPMFQAKSGVPPLLLIGVSSPRVLVSEPAVALLSSDELRVAVRHELEHARSRDNLKKLVLHCFPFPGMASLEAAWQRAAELAADDAAVSNRREAIDLATALLKLSDLAPLQEAPAFTTGLVNVSAPVSMRVARLLSWHEGKAHAHLLHYALFPAFAALLFISTHYGSTLLLTHRLTEWFVH